MVDYLLMMKGKEILERELRALAKNKGVKLNEELATEFFFDFLKSNGKRVKAYTKSLEKRVFQSRKEAIKNDEEPLNYNEIIALDAMKIYIAERKGIDYKMDRHGNLVFEKEIFQEKKVLKNVFEEDQEELPNIDDLI